MPQRVAASIQGSIPRDHVSVEQSALAASSCANEVHWARRSRQIQFRPRCRRACASARTKSLSNSAPAEWARFIAPGTRASAVKSQSRPFCCRHHSQAEALARFEMEARSASALNHPNIVTIYELGCVDSTHFIAMELVRGETVRTLLEVRAHSISQGNRHRGTGCRRSGAGARNRCRSSRFEARQPYGFCGRCR